MARALKCPTCGSTTRLDGLGADGMLHCEQCGQVMKAPPGIARRTSAPAAETPAVAPGTTGGSGADVAAVSSPVGGATVAPPAPRRRSRPTMTAGGVAATATATSAGGGGTAVLVPEADRPRVAVAPEGAGAVPTARGRDGRTRREALPLWLRIGAWVVALPLGLLVVGIPARQAGYLSSQKLLDVIVKHDTSRFVPIVVIVALWALVTAVLVTIIVEGGRWWMLRRRRSKARAAQGALDVELAPAGRRSGAGRRDG